MDSSKFRTTFHDTKIGRKILLNFIKSLKKSYSFLSK
jgi:hypothetical protein